MGIRKDVLQMLRQESSSVTSEPVRIPFIFEDLSSVPKIEDRNDEDKKYYDYIKGEFIEVSPPLTRTWFRFKPLLFQFEEEDKSKLIAKQGTGFDIEVENLLHKYDEQMLSIVHIGIHNKKGGMPDWFKDVLMDNCTWEDNIVLLNAILYRIIPVPDFSKAITATRAVSPLGEAETIALQKNPETWNRKAASCS